MHLKDCRLSYLPRQLRFYAAVATAAASMAAWGGGRKRHAFESVRMLLKNMSKVDTESWLV
jgi:hypothetical protein